jgi:hypothetical protein
MPIFINTRDRTYSHTNKFEGSRPHPKDFSLQKNRTYYVFYVSRIVLYMYRLSIITM